MIDFITEFLRILSLAVVVSIAIVGTLELIKAHIGKAEAVAVAVVTMLFLIGILAANS